MEDFVEQGVMETLPPAADFDLTPLLDMLTTTNELLQVADLALLVLCGIVLGCTISLVLAVMLK